MTFPKEPTPRPLSRRERRARERGKAPAESPTHPTSHDHAPRPGRVDSGRSFNRSSRHRGERK